MAKWMAEMDQRTRLAGGNKMELLMFHLGTEETYGINVFKIREVMKIPPVVKIPDSDPRILGLVNRRGENIALVDLKQAIGLDHWILREPNSSLRNTTITSKDFLWPG